jgi:hypothetical protein
MMIDKVMRYLRHANAMRRINVALSRGAATAGLRTISPENPLSWEFSAFSQNGEDGIIDYLTTKIRDPNYYFIEIGASDGIENNSAWLAIAKKHSGLMVEGDPKSAQRCNRTVSGLNLGVECLNLFMDKDNVKDLTNFVLHKNPDLFSLDIDGNDYYIAQSVINAGFRPKIWVVEYNSAFGPTNPLSIEYRKDFDWSKAHETRLYYGVSIAGWKKIFLQHGYKFVTVERHGVNAVFIDAEAFDSTFSGNIKGLEFQENFYQENKFKTTWMKQFELIKHLPFVEL